MTLSIAELGQFSLALALCVALVQSIVPLWGAHRGDGAMMAMARPGAVALFGLVAVAFACPDLFLRGFRLLGFGGGAEFPLRQTDALQGRRGLGEP